MSDDARLQHHARLATPRAWLNLSLAQQAVWLDATLSGASAYQLGGWAKVRGVLDEMTVRQSISLLMGRHDALRLRIDDELPRQWVDASVEPPLTVCAVPDDEGADAWFAAHVAEVSGQPLPLGDHPLFRIELIRAGRSHSYLSWRFHHLIADSVSVSVTLGHWFQIYDALASDTARELAPGSSYIAAIESDAAYLESATYQKDLAYWTARFDPLPPPLVADLEMHATGRRDVPVAAWTLSGDEAAACRAAAARAKTTMQRAICGLFAVTVGRRYGQTDVVSGMALHRRDAANRHTIGMLAGVIAVRCLFEPYWSLEECVQAFSEQVDADLRHQRLPVDVLSRALGLANRGRAGLFEVAMSYLPNERLADASLGGQSIVAGGDLMTREASPISLHVSEQAEGGVALRIAVNPDFLPDTEAAALGNLYRVALQQFGAGGTSRFEELPSVTADERRLVIDEWNATTASFPTGRLDALVAAQAAQTPDAVAVVGEDGTALTYAALVVRADAVARGLVARGVRPGDVVGVAWPRSLDTVVALLAILRAGGVYLPLDPAYPAERRAFMAADAGATLVLTSLDEVDADARGALLLPTLNDPAARAYIIYTSGTTGQPKGVAVSHGAAVNLASARRACHDPLGVGDRVLAAIAVGFDVSIGQLLLPLLSGATVVIAGDVKLLGAAGFWAWLATRGVTHVNAVPSFLAAVLDAAPAPHALRLRRLMLGGEALTGSLVARLHAALPDVTVVNMYGPTETCIDATYHVATPADTALAVLPIGRPLSNYRVYVLDAQQQSVGVGVSGELYIGGAGLAEGYVGRPDLTASRFVADPFNEPGARLYRTGDRARWRADGALEFLGRVDQQVKIRGFRVEPEEIAAVLQTHAAVAHAAVVPQTSGGVVRLVAYVVPRGAAASTRDLREHVAERVPDYMVPAAIVSLTRIPLTANGKLDVAALPSPDWQATSHYVAPRTSTEEAIAALFAEVLNLPRCGATDHFFELGGDSLLATSLVSRMRSLSVTFPLRAVFDTPTVEALARRVDEMWRQSLPQDHAVPAPRPSVLPLAYPQERIWFIDQLQHDGSYNIPLAFDVRGSLNLDAVDRSVAFLIERHEVLRTRIVLRDNRLVQEVFPQGTCTIDRVDLTTLAPEAQGEALRAHRHEVAAFRFDLTSGSPLHGRVLICSPHRHVLLLVIHHVVCDGWSAGIFVREFSECYAAHVSGRPVTLAQQSTQYADFAVWQRAQEQDADLAYWLNVLRDAPKRLELPLRTRALSPEEPACGTVRLALDSELVTALTSLGRAHGASLFMVLHAALSTLFARVSGQDDVVIGTVVANRQRPEFESVFGCFVNTLALRTQVRAGESFVQLLERVREDDLAAFDHQDLPFEQLVDALHPERSLDHAPVVQVMFVLQNTPQRALSLPGLSLTPQPIEPAGAKFDLAVNVAEEDSGVTVTFEHARQRFDQETVEALASQYANLLRGVAAEPTLDPTALDMLDVEDRAMVVDRFNDTAAVFPDATLEALFARQVAAAPDAAAVIDVDGRTLSYRALDERSTALAKYLVTRGVAREGVVGVRMPRSADTIVSLLAILKAGGVYLPLDLSYPAHRLDYIAANAGAHLVLDSIAGCEGDAPLPLLTDASRLAYIIYTSGTTGQPKGVAVSHAALVNLSCARRACHDPLGPGDRVLAGIAVGFDVSIEQLLLPLLAGATVVVAGDIKTMGPDGFWSLLAQQRVTHVNSVPSFIASVIDAASAHQPLALARLIVGGEVLTGDLAARIHRALPGVELVNVYGPTEACIEATYYVVSVADHTSAGLPIGRPLSNYRAYVLDARRRPVGPGMAGELYLGGAGLARGYVKSPELTDERFLHDPFCDVPGGRMYRTGDRARWRRDGQLDFLGRVDSQVKIRGFRVEPDEVASQLRRIPGIGEAAVVPQASSHGLRLVAYYTAATTHEPEALRRVLADVLPEYMVPSAFVALDSLPLTANGKLDTRALPAPGDAAFAARPYEPPQGDVEERIAAVWCELLQRSQVGRHDNFFELGGHSLLVVTLSERLRQVGDAVDVQALFRTPTIAGLAASLTIEAPHDESYAGGIPGDASSITPEMLPLVSLSQAQLDRIVAVVPGGARNVQDIYPLAPLQEGIFFQHLMADAGDPYLTPFVLAFDSRGRLEAFVDALRRVVGRHDALRTSLAWEGLDAPVQVVQRQVELACEEVSVEVAPGADDALRQLLMYGDPAHVRLDVRRAPLVRLTCAWDGQRERWLLLLLAHHLVLDHTSLEVIVHDVRAWMTDASRVLPPVTPYRAFVQEARAAAASERHAEYFRTHFADVTEPTTPYGLLELRSGGAPVREARRTIAVDLADRIRSQARLHSVTPAALFHLAWGLVVGHVSSSSDPVFGTVLLGRMKSGQGAARGVGMFINTLPFRVTMTSSSVVESLRQTHDALAELLAHEHAPLAVAQRCSGVAAPAPLFSSLFNYRYSPESAETAWPGVEFVYASERTNYPLSMAVDDTERRFVLTALGQAPCEPERVCEYLHEAVRQLVDQLEASPSSLLSAIGVLSADERRLVIDEWNATTASFPTGRLDALVRAQAAQTPDAVAVVGEDGAALTYAALVVRADAVARGLVARGVRPGDVVGVAWPRSLDTVVALLAILRAGGVYLPLDPAYPAERRTFMAADAGATLVLTSLDEVDADARDTVLLPTLNDPAERAYIIYTSGTTGQPKGVAVSHGAAVNLASARRACHDPLGVGDRVLAAIAVGFDVSIGQLLLPLLSGATVVIAGDVKLLGAAGFWAWLATRGVTHVNAVPSFLAAVLDAAPAPQSLRLRRLMLGGEALAGSLIARLHAALPDVTVVNMYGPTETCIDATYHVATPADTALAVLPIGRPLSNYRVYVLDAQQQPVGVGVSGELYIGGAGLAEGYVGRPDLTASRFVADPFDEPGARLYRTGDRARWRADGALEFLGRVDQQVKIRGFRVEPEEIAAVLRQHPAVQDAVVVARGSEAEMRLVGYYTGDPVDAAALRQHLASHLPDYMVPSALVALARIPLTAHGKLDVAALPTPSLDDASSRASEPPSGAVEERIAALWSDLLGVERIGRHDNFFELGGHSLLAITVSERMQQAGIALDVRSLFASPTVAAIAALAQSAIPAAPASESPSIADGTTALTASMLPQLSLSDAQLERIVAQVPGGAANIQDVYPLAPLQEGILFEHLLGEAADPYIAPFLLAFDTGTRLDAFLRALNQIVARHDVLRTAFVWQGLDEPLQVVLRQASMHIDRVILDLSPGGPSAAEQLLARCDHRTFRIDVTRAPLMHIATAYDAAQGRWLLLLLTHHLILDHTSMEIVVHELRVLMADGRAALPAPSPYRRFVTVSRAARVDASHDAFFWQMLGDVDEPSAPFGVVAREPGGSLPSETQLLVSDDLAKRLRALARANGVSTAALFHLAWAAVLAHVSGRNDVVFGTVLLGRLGAGTGADRTVGMFINTLPMRVRVDERPLAPAVADTQRLLADLLAHEHTPLATALRASGMPARVPLFSSLFNYRFSPAPQTDEAWPGVEMLLAEERTNYPLAMAVDDTAASFRLTALTDGHIDAARVCQYFETALDDVALNLERQPVRPLSAIGVLPADERRLVIDEWNATTASFPTGRLDALVAAQAAQTPDAVAVVGEDGTALTYAALVARADAVACGLVARGVRPGDVVGVAWPRSLDTVVALLAILRAGGVYLPLDPAYPAERRAFMAADAGATLVLTSLDEVDPGSGAAAVGADARDAGLLPTLNDPAARAYIIYTSGTTGQPKGVAVSHGAAVNLASARRACHDPLGVGDRVLAAIAVGFDVSIGQLLLPLLSGATVVIAGDVKLLGAAGFWAWLATRGVTHVNAVPSFLAAVLDAAPAPHALRLRRLMLGGEALTGSLVARLHAALPDVTVVNMYGPTETCIDATYHVATPADTALAVLPIGRPLSNYRVYVLDAQQQPVGIGVSGELYIGGAGLADGYIGLPDLTASRFVADPFGTPGARLYRTGDRARWRADGALEFLGRVDRQVKIRGFRVEPEEIAVVLRQHPAVQDAVVVAHGREAEMRLVGYYTSTASADASALRQHLAAQLPDYMVPTALVPLAGIPLTPNGKLDVAALPAADLQAPLVFVAPRTSTEDAVARLFASVLHLPRCGATDHFFALGGDSLATMRLVAAASEQFGINLPVRALLEHSTVAALAAQIDAGLSQRPSYLVPLQSSGSRTPLFCVHPAGGHALCYMPLSQQLGEGQPLYGLQASGVEVGEPLAASIEEMATEYLAAVQHVQAEGPYQLLGMSSGGLIAFEMARQLRDRGEDVRVLVMLDTTVPNGQPGDFTDTQLTRAMAGELGIVDLLDAAREPLSLAALVTRAVDAGRVPAGFTVAHAQRLASVFRNTVACHFAYRPEPLAVPTLLVRALQRERDGDQPPDWTPFIDGSLDVHDLDCSHGDLVSRAWAPDVATLVSEYLNGTRE